MGWINSALVDTFMAFQLTTEIGPFSTSFILFSTTPSSAEPTNIVGRSQPKREYEVEGKKENPNQMAVPLFGRLHEGEEGQSRPLLQCQALH